MSETLTAAARRQRATDRADQAWQLRLRGKTEREIAAALGLNQSTVHRLLERAEREVLADARQMVMRIKARQASRLEWLYGEALDAFERSKREAVKSSIERTTAPGMTPEQAAQQPAKSKVQKEGRDGDPAWATVLLGIHDRIAALWGLNAPAKVQVGREQSPAEHLNDVELLAAAERELAEERRRLGMGGEVVGDGVDDGERGAA